MKKKSVSSDNARKKMEKDTDILKDDLEKVKKSHDAVIQKMKSDADSSKSSENGEIDTLSSKVFTWK